MTQYYYLALLLASLVVTMPWIFLRPVYYHTAIPMVLLATVPVAVPFIIFDSYFTRLGVWGFNSTYHLPYTFFSLPFEEYLFFLIIPISSLFIYRISSHHLHKNKYIGLLRHLSPLFIVGSIVILLSPQNRMYTDFIAVLVLVSVSINYFQRRSQWLGVYYLSYIILLLPFLLVNGVLTGLFTDFPIVFYSSLEFSGKRVFTIPLEDFAYGFSYLLFIVSVFERIIGRTRPRRSYFRSIAH